MPKSALDAALDEIHRVCRKTGAASVDLSVRADGRVEIRFVDRRGFVVAMRQADVDRESGYPLASVAFNEFAKAEPK